MGMFILTYGIGNATAANPSTIYVNTHGNDSWTGLNSTHINGTLNGPKATIKNATGTVNSGGKIYIANGKYDESNININTNMTIIGASQTGTIINAGELNNIFNIPNNAKVIIENLTFTNANSTSNGGAIYNSYGNLTVTNVTFTNNTANYGIIYNYNGYLIVNNDTFTHNTAADGGAIFNNGILNVTDCSFIRNSANGTYGGYGGAIYNVGFMNVTASNFANNNATNWGGAVFGYSDRLIINGSSFTNNTAAQGGAIYNSGNSTINFNRIIENNGYAIYSTAGTVNATLNWWGSNNGPLTNEVIGANVTSWLVLTIKANNVTIGNNAKSIIIANLLYDNHGTYHNPVNGHAPNGVPITFTTTLGTINKTIFTSNGQTESTLTGGSIAGKAIITAILDNQNVKTNVTIKDTIPPVVTSTIPANNAKSVSLTSSIIIKFNENISAAANYTGIYIKNLSTGNTVTLASKSINGNTLTITTTSDHLSNDTYQVYIPASAVKDKAGNNLTKAYTFQFKTV